MPRIMTGGQINLGPGWQQLTRPVSLPLILQLNWDNLETIPGSLLACFQISPNTIMHPSPPSPIPSEPHVMQPVRQESNGRRMCSSSLVTASSTSAVWFPDVSKHPGAVLLLAAQQSTLLTFNESLIIFFFCGEAMLPPFALMLRGSEHARSHLRTTHVEITGIQRFDYATNSPYIRA